MSKMSKRGVAVCMFPLTRSVRVDALPQQRKGGGHLHAFRVRMEPLGDFWTFVRIHSSPWCFWRNPPRGWRPQNTGKRVTRDDMLEMAVRGSLGDGSCSSLFRALAAASSTLAAEPRADEPAMPGFKPFEQGFASSIMSDRGRMLSFVAGKLDGETKPGYVVVFIRLVFPGKGSLDLVRRVLRALPANTTVHWLPAGSTQRQKDPAGLLALELKRRSKSRRTTRRVRKARRLPLRERAD